MTTHQMKARSPISAMFYAIAGGLTLLAGAFHFATPREPRHAAPKTPGGRQVSPRPPAAGPPAEFWGPDNDPATEEWVRGLGQAISGVVTEPPLDPLPPDVVLHSQPDVAWPGEWEPPTAQLRRDDVLAELTRREPRQHYATGLCWCGDCHDQAVTGDWAETDLAICLCPLGPDIPGEPITSEADCPAHASAQRWESPAENPEMCPEGCGCRLDGEDADRRECGCPGPCTGGDGDDEDWGEEYDVPLLPPDVDDLDDPGAMQALIDWATTAPLGDDGRLIA